MPYSVLELPFENSVEAIEFLLGCLVVRNDVLLLEPLAVQVGVLLVFDEILENWFVGFLHVCQFLLTQIFFFPPEEDLLDGRVKYARFFLVFLRGSLFLVVLQQLVQVIELLRTDISQLFLDQLGQILIPGLSCLSFIRSNRVLCFALFSFGVAAGQ